MQYHLNWGITATNNQKRHWSGRVACSGLCQINVSLLVCLTPPLSKSRISNRSCIITQVLVSCGGHPSLTLRSSILWVDEYAPSRHLRLGTLVSPIYRIWLKQNSVLFSPIQLTSFALCVSVSMLQSVLSDRLIMKRRDSRCSYSQTKRWHATTWQKRKGTRYPRVLLRRRHRWWVILCTGSVAVSSF